MTNAHRSGDGSRPTKSVSRATLTTQVEESLRVDIIEGLHKPTARLRAVELAAQYGVSATPLREALQRLAAEGLVQIDARLGAFVAPVSLEDLRDVYDVRIILESQALHRSVQRADAEWVDRLTHAMGALRQATVEHEWPIGAGPLDQRDAREAALKWSAAHRAFNEALFVACDSRWLVRFVRILYDHSERYRMLSLGGHGIDRNALLEHERIFEAASAQDAFKAVSRLTDHLRATVAALDGELSSTEREVQGVAMETAVG